MKNEAGLKKIHTVCRVEDGSNCRIAAHVKDGKLLKVEPVDFPTPGMRHICNKGLCTVRDLVYHPDRLKHPLLREGKRGEGKWKRISWEEAIDTIAENLQRIIDRYGAKAIAFTPGQIWTSCLMGIYQRLASALGATWVNLSGFGDAAGPCGDMLSYGFPIGHGYTTDIENPRFCLVWGGNWIETHALTWRRIRNMQEAGARVVVIDPRFTVTASKADEYISIIPGTDTALALGMMRVVRDESLLDQDFLKTHTVGPFLVRRDNGMFLREKDVYGNGSDGYLVWDEGLQQAIPATDSTRPALEKACALKDISCSTAFSLLSDVLDQYPVDRVSTLTGVPADTIHDLAVTYGTERPAVCFRGWGPQRTFHGDLAWRAMTTLAALTGNINLQGPRGFELNRDAFTTVGGKIYHYLPLLTLYDAIANGTPYPVKGLWIAAHNFVNQNPNYNRVINELFPKLDFIATVDLFMNASARHSDIVLPACSFYEYKDLLPPFESSNPYLQLQQKAIEPLYECRSHVDIGNAIGKRMGFDADFSHDEDVYIDMLLSADHPSMAGVSHSKLMEAPIKVPDYETPVFFTPSGRLEFYAEKMASHAQALPVYKTPIENAGAPLSTKYPLLLINGHTKYLKCSMFTNSSVMRQFLPEPVVELHPQDAASRNIENGAMVTVFNDRGTARMRAKVHEGVHPGVVNATQGWWPENYASGTHQALTHDLVNEAQVATWEPNAAYNDILVDVSKEGA